MAPPGNFPIIITGLVTVCCMSLVWLVTKSWTDVRNTPTLRSRRFQVYTIFWTLQYIALYFFVYLWTQETIKGQFPKGGGLENVGLLLNLFVTIPFFTSLPFFVFWRFARRLQGIVENDIGMPGARVESYTYPQVELQFSLSILTNLLLAVIAHAAFVLNVLIFSKDQAAISFVFFAQMVGGMALIAGATALYYLFGRKLLETCRTKQNFLATPPLIDNPFDAFFKTKSDEDTILREAIAAFDPVTMTEDEPEVAAKPFPKFWIRLGGSYAVALIALFCLAVMFPFNTPRQVLIRAGIIHDYTVPGDFVPWNAERYYRRGIREDDPQRAIEEYSIAIRLNPKYAEAYSARARCWLRLSDVEQKEVNIEKAIADMTEAIRVTILEVWSVHHYIDRSEMYERLGESEKALADLTEVIRITAPNKQYYMFRANLYDRLGEPEKAAADFEKAK